MAMQLSHVKKCSSKLHILKPAVPGAVPPKSNLLNSSFTLSASALTQIKRPLTTNSIIQCINFGFGALRRSNHGIQIQLIRNYAVAQRKSSQQVVETSDPTHGVSTAKKVKEAGKDATYTGLALVGFGVTGLMFFAIGRELFSSQSPSGIYGDALKLCMDRTEVTDLTGLPMKGYGEMTKRGRRRHVSHTEYERDGQKFMRMKFYIEGPMAKGTVNLEMKKDENGKWDYRYLFADIDDIYRRTVVLIDNR